MQWTAKTGKTLQLKVGDITRVPADAVVNAANSALAGGGGVDGAIHRAGGPSIMAELRQIRGGCPTGSAVATSAGHLPARFVFHAVGPVYENGKNGEPELLASCYRKCFQLAEQNGVRTMSFPAISTGIYGYPMTEAARIAIREITGRLESPACSVEQVTLVLFDQRVYDVHAQALRVRTE